MSLLRPAWVYAALMLGVVGATLWFLLAPSHQAIDYVPPAAAVDTTLAKADPIDLAISSGLFSASGETALNAVPDAGSSPNPAASAPRVVGIAIKARGHAIALAVDATGATHLMKPGEAVDGWTLASLSRAGAEFTRDGQREIVLLGQTKTPDSGVQSAGAAVATVPPSKQAGSAP
jgi:hypothetical protein